MAAPGYAKGPHLVGLDCCAGAALLAVLHSLLVRCRRRLARWNGTMIASMMNAMTNMAMPARMIQPSTFQMISQGLKTVAPHRSC